MLRKFLIYRPTSKDHTSFPAALDEL